MENCWCIRLKSKWCWLRLFYWPQCAADACSPRLALSAVRNRPSANGPGRCRCANGAHPPICTNAVRRFWTRIGPSPRHIAWTSEYRIELHCAKGPYNDSIDCSVPPSDLLLRLGEHDLSTESEPYLHQERRVQIVASHPQFDPRTFEYDLALLRFYEPITFQPNILPVCVPQTDENFVGRTAYVTGWGRLYEGMFCLKILSSSLRNLWTHYIYTMWIRCANLHNKLSGL